MIYIGMIVCLSWLNDQVIGYNTAGCYCKGNSAGEIIKIVKKRNGKTFITVNVLAGSKYQQSTILLNAKDSIK